MPSPCRTVRPLSEHFSPVHQRRFAAAVVRLRSQIGRKPFAQRDGTYGAAGETLRAYRNWRIPPGQVFRGWAAGICERLEGHALHRSLQSRAEFLQWHAFLAADLQAYWRSRQKGELRFAYQYKLVDLFIKWLSGHDFGDPLITQGFVEYANCALDRQVLTKLNECLSGALPMPAPSMGQIENRHTYEFCQDLVAEFSASCGATPLLFDYYAWKPGG